MATYTYTYNNGLRDIVVTIPFDCVRFHSCKAYERFVDFGNGHRVYDFTSYETPICSVDYDNGYYNVVVSWQFNCSRTTIQQFSRWLREHAFPFSYYDVKQAAKMLDRTGEIYTNSNGTVIIHF